MPKLASYRNQSIDLLFLYDGNFGVYYSKLLPPSQIVINPFLPNATRPYPLKTSEMSQLTFTCSKSTIETLEKVVKYVQS